jgi:hypothetical protein
MDESDSRGTTPRDERGMWEVVWCDRRPAGHHYVWDLTHARS